MTAESPTPLVTLHEKIHHLEIEQNGLVLPNAVTLEGNIQHHAARIHSIDPLTAARHKDALQEALEAQRLGELAWKRNGEINRELALLRQEVGFAEHEERQHRAAKANKEMDEASQDYLHACKQVVRAYRRCMAVSTRNQGIPGAFTQLPPGFHVAMRGFGSGHEHISTSQEMAMTLLGVEREEQL